MVLNYHELTLNEPRSSPARRKQFLVITIIMSGLLFHSAMNAGAFMRVNFRSSMPADGIGGSAIERTSLLFPGGEFVYKLMSKDYAASSGCLRTVWSDLGGKEHNDWGSGEGLFPSIGGLFSKKSKYSGYDPEEEDGGKRSSGTPSDPVDLLFTLFMDDEAVIPGGLTRFAGGALLPAILPAAETPESRKAALEKEWNESKAAKEAKEKENENLKVLSLGSNETIEDSQEGNGEERPKRDWKRRSREIPQPLGNTAKGDAMKEQLLKVNDSFAGKTAVGKGSDGVHSKDVKYQVGSLPRTKAIMLQFPFTDGGMSALVQSFKIFPAFKAYAKRKNVEPAIILRTCSAKQQMCTYFMPLQDVDKFMLNQPSTEDYAKEFGDFTALQKLGIEFEGFTSSIFGERVSNVIKGLKKALGFGCCDKHKMKMGDEESKEEL